MHKTRSQPRSARACSRAGCRSIATRTLIYIYADSTAMLGPLATFAEPHAYDLCDLHSARLTVPNGWTVIAAQPLKEEIGPNDDDLMAIADAVREVAVRAELHSKSGGENYQGSIGNSSGVAEPTTSGKKNYSSTERSEIGRRGHLRSVPTEYTEHLENT